MTGVIARDGKKGYRTGTHRSRSPEETLADFGRHTERVGITRIANLTGLDWVGIPVYSAIRPNSRSLSVSQGKAATHVGAKVSAMMESIEYWHAEYLDLPLRHESYRQLASEGDVVDIDRLPCRGGLDGIDANSPQIPARATFAPELPMLWLTGQDLVADRPRWLPFETVRLNKVGMDYAAATFRVSSNGLASGNTIAEATLHGMCELIERDSLTLWWQDLRTEADVLRTKLDLDSVADPVCRELIDQFDAAGLDVAVWDVASDLAVPTYQCCVLEKADRAVWRPFGACWGYGTHPAPEVALSRALTEAAQSRVTVIAASRDENFPAKYAVQNDPAKARSVRRTLFAKPGRLDFTSRAGLGGQTSCDDVDAVLDRLRTAGLTEVVAVDLTKPELGIPVVKIVIPGLEFYSLFVGYAPGRRARERAARGQEAKA